MKDIPGGWTQRNREAYRAWEKGDDTGLIKACEPLIKSLAKSIAENARRGRSDELSQPSRHRRFEQGRHKKAALAEDGLREAMEVVDFDDLRHVGYGAVLDAKERYDPDRKTPFQIFAYKRIQGAMRDLLAEQRKREAEQASFDSSEVAPLDQTAQLVALAQQGELDDSFVEQVALFLSGHETLDDWRDYIQRTPFELVRFFWWFLYRFGDDLDPKVGKAKRLKMLSVATIRYFVLRLRAATDKGAKFIDVSGPQHLEIIERGRKAAKAYPAKLDNKPAGRLLSEDKKKPIDGKTIARWRKDMGEVGVPPLIKEDGSFTLKSQEDYDAWNEYSLKIAHPRVWRRLRRRRQRDSQ